MAKALQHNGQKISSYFVSNIGWEGCLGAFMIGCFLLFGQI